MSGSRSEISKDGAMKMLRGGRTGVNKWNKLRKAGAGIPDLSSANLRGANLQNADLSSACLARANLTYANMSAVNLVDACLSGAYLYGAGLRGADLCRANLKAANLMNANLMNAKLGGVTFDRAICGGTNFDTILSVAVGLNDTLHHVSSTVTPASIAGFTDQIPENFLRGCGWSDEWIEFARSQIGSPVRFYASFISYSHADRVFVRRLHDQLQGRGIRCWLDEHNMDIGDPIYQAVNQAIRTHDKLIVCCSEASLNSAWVMDELTAAFEQERKKKRRVLIPIDLDGYFHEWDGMFAPQLRGRLAANFKGWENDNSIFEAQFERVVKALKPRDM